MSDRYISLDVDLPFRSPVVGVIAAEMWREFFCRLEGLNVDRAIWICNEHPAWFGIKPGGPDDDPDDEPAFVISTSVGAIDEWVDTIFAGASTDTDLLNQLRPIYDEYYAWLKAGIQVAWRQTAVQSLRSRSVHGRFGVYATTIEDIGPDELAEMEWLAGDKLW